MRARAWLYVVAAIASGFSVLPSPVLGQGGQAPCAVNNCDSNGDGGRDISDAVAIFTFLFLGGEPLVPYCQGVTISLENGDCNGDKALDLSDGIRLLGWLFAGLPAPVEDSNPDSDGDGVPDATDSCPLDPNAGQEDADADGVGDACDICPSGNDTADADRDGAPDACDNCPQLANAGQEDTDTDGIGNLCDSCPNGSNTADADTDGVADACDNCPQSTNAGQEDADADGIGDICDACPSGSNTADADGDGDPDACDNCPQTANPGQEDADQDGVGDACEISGGTYAGSLTRTRGRWSFVPGQVGLQGANSLCAEKFPGSSACTIDQLIQAEAAGELAGAADFNGVAVTSFWVNRPEAQGVRQCIDPTRENIPWTYQTAHIATHGEFVTLSAEGDLSEIQLIMDHCQAQRWVACCNE